MAALRSPGRRTLNPLRALARAVQTVGAVGVRVDHDEPGVEVLSGRGRSARKVLDLAELQQIARSEGREHVTLLEFARVWDRTRRHGPETLRRAVYRLRTQLLEEHSVNLRVVGKRPVREVHVATPELLDVVARLVRGARLEEAERAAGEAGLSREERAERQATLEQLRRELASTERSGIEARLRERGRSSYGAIRKEFRVGYGRIKALERLAKIEPRWPTRRLRIEDVRPAAVVRAALEAYDRGATLREVAGILAPCSHRTASTFLRRHGRRPGRWAEGRQLRCVRRDGDGEGRTEARTWCGVPSVPSDFQALRCAVSRGGDEGAGEVCRRCRDAIARALSPGGWEHGPRVARG